MWNIPEDSIKHLSDAFIAAFHGAGVFLVIYPSEHVQFSRNAACITNFFLGIPNGTSVPHTEQCAFCYGNSLTHSLPCMLQFTLKCETLEWHTASQYCFIHAHCLVQQNLKYFAIRFAVCDALFCSGY
jgi:hypothetical protein